MMRQPGQAVCATVLAATMVCLMYGSAEAQDFGLDSGSTTGDPSQFDPGFPDSGESPDFSFEQGGGPGGPGFGPGQPPDEFIKMIIALYGAMFAVALIVGLTLQAVVCWL